MEEFKNQYNMYEAEKKLQCLSIENGIVLPRRFTPDCPRWGAGGVCDADGRFIELSKYQGGWGAHGGYYTWDKAEEESNDCEVVYFGLFIAHWGHLMVDLIGRLWYFSQNTEIPENVKLAYVGEDTPVGNYLEFFELLGIAKERLIRIEKPTRFKKVIVPEFSCRIGIWYTKEYVSIFDRIANTVKEEQHSIRDIKNLEKIYFSRKNFGKAKSSEFGEALLQRWFETNGYTAISPERLSLRDQVYIWNHASTIACINGSIPINIAFSQNESLNLIVVNKTRLEHINLEAYLLMRPCHMVYLNAYREPIPGYPKSIGEGPFLIDLGSDIRMYSDQMQMIWPFSQWEITCEYVKNLMKLVLSILGIKRRFRCVMTRMVPQNVKAQLKRIRNMIK